MTTIAVSQVVSRVRSSVGAADTPDFFSMIDQQARMIVNLARVVAEMCCRGRNRRIRCA